MLKLHVATVVSHESHTVFVGSKLDSRQGARARPQIQRYVEGDKFEYTGVPVAVTRAKLA